MLKSKYFLYIIFLWLILVIGNCNCYRSKIVINNVFLDIPFGLKELSTESAKETLKIDIKETIKNSKGFSFNEKASSGQELKITISGPMTNKEEPSLLMLAILHNPNQEEAKQYKAWVDISLKNGDLTKDDFLKSLSSLLNNLFTLRMKGLVSVDEYIEKIDKKLNGENISSTELLNAIAILQEAKDKRSVSKMIALLEKTSDLALGNALMMALGDIGDEEAMPSIIEFSQRKPSIIRRQAIIAARKIGSKLAAEWLLVMAYGYDDEVVQEEAKAALEVVMEKLGLKEQE